MKAKKIGKILLILICVVAFLLPFGIKVFAVEPLTSETQTAQLSTIDLRKGANGSKDAIYRVDDVNVLKILQVGDSNYIDTIYCLNAGYSFPVASGPATSFLYTNKGDLTDIKDQDVKDLYDLVGLDDDTYNGLIYLLSNAYLMSESPSYKEEFLQKAFADLIFTDQGLTVDNIMSELSDNDIDVVQQWAIWHFTNGSNSSNDWYNSRYTDLDKITLSSPVLSGGSLSFEETDIDGTRLTYMKTLYNYLISSAKKAVDDGYTAGSDLDEQQVTYPAIDTKTAITSEVDGRYYKVGPFKVTSGNYTPDDFTLNLKFYNLDGTEIKTSDVAYKICDASGKEISKTYDQIFDQSYYIYLPTDNNTVSKVELTSSYTEKPIRTINLWTGEDSTGTYEHLQPVAVIDEKPGEQISEVATGTVKEEKYDLALRKYIVSINNISTTGREPVVSGLTELANGTKSTATYTHDKNPLTVRKGDKIVYEFRIYNEGKIDADSVSIVDYIPAGLKVIENTSSTINSKYNWTVGEPVNGYTKVTATSSDTINAFNGQTLDYTVFQIECELVGDLPGGTILKNIAEVIKDDGSDIDSVPDNLIPSSDFTDAEDDDDYEQITVLVPEGEYELQLQKVDKNGNIITSSEANFSWTLPGGSLQTGTTSNGKLNLGTVQIKDLSSPDSITITETKAPNGYNALINSITIQVNKKEQNGEYVVDGTPTITSGGVQGAKVELNGKVITVTVPNEPIVGNYEVKLQKVDKNENIITSSEASFSWTLPGGSLQTGTTTNGQLSLGTVQITDISTPDSITITETKAPSGYNALINSLTIQVNKKEQSGEYVVDGTPTITSGGVQGARVELNGNVITVTVPNEPIVGNYEVKLQKVDKNGNIITSSEASFSWTLPGGSLQTGSTIKGQLNLGTVQITDVSTPDSITITETKAPDGYKALINTITLQVNKKEQGGQYVVDGIPTITSGGVEGTKVELNGNVITITVPNEQKYYDLALRKYIVSVDGEQTTGRVPSVSGLDKLADGSSNDAVYTHSKDVITVEKDSKIIYEFRVYNEGEVDAVVGSIIDYLPEGLSLVSDSSINATYGWSAGQTTNGYTEITSTYLNGKTIPAFDKNNLNLSYVSLQVECEITGNIEDGTVLKNIAEITADDGNDRDSVPDNVTPSSSFTDAEDDDDYEQITVHVEKIQLIDLALRKYIYSINGNQTSGREPVVSESSLRSLANGTTLTADYLHAKNPLEVEKGDKIVYEFRIYNEGNIDASVERVVDYLPDGLSLATDSTINSTYGWTSGTVSNGYTAITSTYLSGTTISAFNKNDLDLSYVSLQVECEVTGDFEDGTVLTNVAEIAEDSGIDRDSNTGTINQSSISNDYTGNSSNKSDLSDSDYYYKGIEDDDDFEKITITSKDFDLALKKFTTKLNSDDITYKIPTADPSALNSGEIDASYETNKTPITVESGDVVTFTLRIYNEGEISGYAEQITDYIPEGLGYLVDYNTNINNGWNVSDGTTVKLSTILNGTENLSTSDFTGVDNLDDAEVVLGKVKVTTNALSSNDTNNLIPAFDGENLSYKDIQITCIVTTNDEVTLKNISAITAEKDDEGNEIETDRGSKDIDSTPIDDINPDEYGTGNEDDDDYDLLKTSKINYDLALRKFIVSVNNESTSGREPVVSGLQELADGTNSTAIYSHEKSPLTVKQGDRVVYEFRIYNEGNKDGICKDVVDYIPEGLSLVSPGESTVNSKYNWTEGKTSNGYTAITTNYLNSTVIPAFDSENLELSYVTVQVELEVTDKLNTGTVLTNVAEILEDDGMDIDSNTGSINQSTITDDFKGNKDNKTDLSDSDYYYKGIEDDDDFEKLIINEDVFDLSLQKFITTVNDEEYDREPTVDVSPLNEGEIDAKYMATKTPVDVVTGDIVTFTLRVYNEGDIAGYADKITDYIPEGLGFLVNYQTNYDNYWSVEDDSSSVKLSTIKNGTKNLSADDFVDVDSLDDVEVVLGRTKVTSTVLSYSDTNNTNLIPAFDGENLSYKDIQITCIVTTEDEITLKNIAAITGEKNEDGEDVPTDREDPNIDSTPEDDINPDEYTTGNEDDDDYDVLKTSNKDFDLALQKFITGLNDQEITNRVPTLTTDKDGNIVYTHTSDALSVGNGDLVTYTIRVYNEGDIDGYAAEITDDIPNGLKFVPDNETNIEYGWEMIDSSGNVTDDVNQAVAVRTTHLSKEASEDNLIHAFDKEAGLSATNPDYKDVKLVFQVDELAIDRTTTTEERTIINTAEISKDTDEDGNEVDDKDSTPGNGNPDEDDIDQEKVYVKYFDLSLKKDLTSAIVTVDGTPTQYNVKDGEDSIKVEVHRKKVDTTTIQFFYNVTVTNEGEIAGYATEITDYIPDGLYFDPADNPDWTQVSDKEITTNALAKTLLQPGESASVQVVLRWEQSADNTGEFINIAEISDDWNEYDSPDVDSTPDNQVPTEDDYDTAPVLVSISTGLGGQPYIILTTSVLLILGTGLVLIKKYVL